PHLASAQNWTLTLTPQVGWYRGTEPLGYGSPDGDLLRMAPSHVVGMLLGVGPEDARWSMRLSFTTTLDADIQRAQLVVPDMCVECIISLWEYGPTDHTGEMMMLGLQGTVSPTPRSWRVSPYLIAGAGLTRFDLGEGR